jgi:hypothetical protein
MIRHFVLGLGTMLAALTATLACAAEDAPTGHVVIVLDCSAHMAAPLAADERAGPTRFESALQAAELLLVRLAQDEKHGVTLVLAGHRIAAAGEGQSAEDGQSLQVDYLKLEAGKLQPVPAGLDVEIVRESRPLSALDLDTYRSTLATLKPWGESPLWLAIAKAAKSAPRDAGESTRIVLITSGTNEQTGVEEVATSKQALAALQAQHASLHVVQLGKVRSSVDMAALQQVALATGGSVLAPRQSTLVARALLVAAGLEAPQFAIADAQVRAAAQVVLAQDAAVQPPPPLVVRDEEELRAQLLKKDVAVEVTYWGQPVKDAKVYLRGKSFDLEYARDAELADKVLREQRLAGIYVFPKVVHGVYLLDITVNHKNRKYAIEREIVVDDDLLDPGRRLLIQIERSKDPPATPAAAPAP